MKPLAFKMQRLVGRKAGGPKEKACEEDRIAAFREIVDAVLSGRINTAEDLESWKKAAASRLHLASLPGNADILAAARDEERERLKILVKKPTRTLSGVAVIAVMTSPARCPHGICVPCPGGVSIRGSYEQDRLQESGCGQDGCIDGKDSSMPSPQSYTGREPAALRAAQHRFDPYDQVAARLSQLHEIGHQVDKAELIIMGGTMTARPRATSTGL